MTNIRILLLLTTVFCCFIMTVKALPAPYDLFSEEPEFKDDAKYQNGQIDNEDRKKLLIDKMLMLMSQEQSGVGYYGDAVRGPDVKKTPSTKKIHNLCHFKLCNLGKR